MLKITDTCSISTTTSLQRNQNVLPSPFCSIHTEQALKLNMMLFPIETWTLNFPLQLANNGMQINCEPVQYVEIQACNWLLYLSFSFLPQVEVKSITFDPNLASGQTIKFYIVQWTKWENLIVLQSSRPFTLDLNGWLLKIFSDITLAVILCTFDFF